MLVAAQVVGTNGLHNHSLDIVHIDGVIKDCIMCPFKLKVYIIYDNNFVTWPTCKQE